MKSKPVRIGIILTKLGGLDAAALKYLVLYQNTLQTTFEYEFLAAPEIEDKDLGKEERALAEFLSTLDSPTLLKREDVEKETKRFFPKYKKWLEGKARDYEITPPLPEGKARDDEITPLLPDGYVILSTARFDDFYFVTDKDDWVLIALGHWKRYMAPPSLVEFFLTQLLANSVDFACGKDSPPQHFPTRGCLFDFSASLEDARIATLTAYVCQECKESLSSAKTPRFVDDVQVLLKKSWLGTEKQPSVASSTSHKLGYDLFHTTGIKPTLWSRLRSTVEQETLKLFLQVLGAVLIAGLLVWFGLKGGTGL